MAQITTLKDKNGGTLYPVTSSKAVFDAQGIDIDTRFSNKVDKLTGKQLSTNDYTDEEKAKLNALPANDRLNELLGDKISRDELKSVLEIIRTRPPQVFIDEFNARCVVSSTTSAAVIKRSTYGGYDPDNAPDPEHPFLLNGLWLSYEEAIEVMRVPDIVLASYETTAFSYSRARTFFPIKGGVILYVKALLMCCPLLEVVRLSGYYITNNGGEPDTTLQRVAETRDFISQCPRLREIQGVLQLPSSEQLGLHFYSTTAPSLETLWLHSLKLPINLAGMPKLRVECYRYMIANAANTSVITATVHADVYAKLTGDTTNAAAAALSPEELAEWQQVCAEANAKNIVFATP